MFTWFTGNEKLKEQMTNNEYHRRIADYYRESENAYRDSWDLDRSLSIHYGYRDHAATHFRASLQRMNEVMCEAAGIQAGEHVLDAGCGVGGSSIFLAKHLGCRVTGVTLSEEQRDKAEKNAHAAGLEHLVDFQVANYLATGFDDASFDVVWGCESICYADNKETFVQEAFRMLRSGGRLVVADGFVKSFEDNQHPVNRHWLDGWQVNYLETPERFCGFMKDAGFSNIHYRDITRQTSHSARRLYRFYFLARAYTAWMRLKGRRPTPLQAANINACRYQYLARKKGISGYGLVTGSKV
jgi:cyclopropane fatty-acyl-phospholipid synthase-like methyltransferase